MTGAVGASTRPYIRSPLATPEQIAAEPAPFPVPTAASPLESCFDDWRQRLTRNLSRRSVARWEPLTYVHPDDRAPLAQSGG